jgi:hypothetical protein
MEGPMGMLKRSLRYHMRDYISCSDYYDFESDPVPPGETWYIDALSAEIDTTDPVEVRFGVRTAGLIYWIGSDAAPIANKVAWIKPRLNLREGESIVIRFRGAFSLKEANCYIIGLSYQS